jgi:hypothetical protein
MAKLQFPLQFKRQYGAPLDVDAVFNSTLEREHYLKDPLCYGGHIAIDLELEQAFIVKADKSGYKAIGEVSKQEFDSHNHDDLYEKLAKKDVANGYAGLDSGAKLPLSHIPDSLIGQVQYQSSYDAAGNVPALTNPPSSDTKGHYYVVSKAGSQFGIDFSVGDWIISNGAQWEKVDNTDAVVSVHGRIGAIVANAGDYNSAQVTHGSGNVESFLNGLNTANWDTAYGWGSHKGKYLEITGGTLTGTLFSPKLVVGKTLSPYNTGELEFVKENSSFNEPVKLLFSQDTKWGSRIQIGVDGYRFFGGLVSTESYGNLYAGNMYVKDSSTADFQKVWHAGNLTPGSDGTDHNHDNSYLGINATAASAHGIERFTSAGASEGFFKLYMGQDASALSGHYVSYKNSDGTLYKLRSGYADNAGALGGTAAANYWHTGNLAKSEFLGATATAVDSSKLGGKTADQFFRPLPEFNNTDPGNFENHLGIGSLRPAATNHPAGAGHGTILAFGKGASLQPQMFFDEASNVFFRKRSYNGIWADWYKLWHSGNLNMGDYIKKTNTGLVELTVGNNSPFRVKNNWGFIGFYPWDDGYDVIESSQTKLRFQQAGGSAHAEVKFLASKLVIGANEVYHTGNLPSFASTTHNHDSSYLKLSGGTLTGLLNVPHVSLNSGGEIRSGFNSAYILKDHANGHVTLSAARKTNPDGTMSDGNLYLGYINTGVVRLHSNMVGSNGSTRIADTNGTLYYQGANIDSKYLHQAGGTIASPDQYAFKLQRTGNIGPVGIQFNDTDTNSQTGYFYADHRDGNSGPHVYSFHFGSSEASTGVILDGPGNFYVGTNGVWHAGNLNPNSVSGSLSVSGNLSFDGTIVQNTANVNMNFIRRTSSAPALYVENHGSGYLASFRQASSQKAYIANDGTMYSPNFAQISDIRRKENIRPIEGASEKLRQLDTFYHTWKGDEDDGREHLGLSAQQLHSIYPEAVQYDEKEDRYWVTYTSLVPVLIAADREKQIRLEAHERTLMILERRLEELERRAT